MKFLSHPPTLQVSKWGSKRNRAASWSECAWATNLLGPVLLTPPPSTSCLTRTSNLIASGWGLWPARGHAALWQDGICRVYPPSPLTPPFQWLWTSLLWDIDGLDFRWASTDRVRRCALRQRAKAPAAPPSHTVRTGTTNQVKRV